MALVAVILWSLRFAATKERVVFADDIAVAPAVVGDFVGFQ